MNFNFMRETLCFSCRKRGVPLETTEPSMKLFRGDDYIVAGFCPQCKREFEEWKEEKRKDDI